MNNSSQPVCLYLSAAACAVSAVFLVGIRLMEGDNQDVELEGSGVYSGTMVVSSPVIRPVFFHGLQSHPRCGGTPHINHKHTGTHISMGSRGPPLPSTPVPAVPSGSGLEPGADLASQPSLSFTPFIQPCCLSCIMACLFLNRQLALQVTKSRGPVWKGAGEMVLWKGSVWISTVLMKSVSEPLLLLAR